MDMDTVIDMDIRIHGSIYCYGIRYDIVLQIFKQITN
jgi:hypothetical protein